MSGCAGPAQIRQGPVYPAALPRADALDIQVIRRGTKIELTNTSARRFGESTMWLNQRYGLGIKGMEVGETVTLPLGDFLDEYSQKFRAGGFFATKRPEKVALAELATETEVVGLVVIGGRDP